MDDRDEGRSGFKDRRVLHAGLFWVLEIALIMEEDGSGGGIGIRRLN